MGQSETSIRCDDCGMPLRSWDERHTIEDCRWWKDTQPMRDALVGLGRMQADLNRIARQS